MDTNLARKASAIPSPYSAEADLVRHALLERGLETPLLPHQFERDEKYQRIRNSFTDIARTLVEGVAGSSAPVSLLALRD